MKVRVRDRRAEGARWGHGGPLVMLRTVEIADRCPTCGGPRGEPALRRYCEDGEWYDVSRWDNPCGHIDLYDDILREAGR